MKRGFPTALPHFHFNRKLTMQAFWFILGPIFAFFCVGVLFEHCPTHKHMAVTDCRGAETAFASKNIPVLIAAKKTTYSRFSWFGRIGIRVKDHRLLVRMLILRILLQSWEKVRIVVWGILFV